MTKWDKDYIKLCKTILKDGVEVENRTGINTIKIPSYHLKFDLSKEFPVLTTKQLYFRQAITEMLWIYQVQSNDVRWLQERNVHIWDEWEIGEDGIWHATQNVMENGKYVKKEIAKDFGKKYAHTIGTAYGYIVNKFDLMRKAIKTIKENPTDRRNVINLFQYDYLDSGTLPPCVYMHQWLVNEDKLDILVYQRSCDVPLGFPFNVSQYAVLANLVAQVTGYKVGKMYWNIGSAHIYENQIDGIKTQLARRKDAKPAPKLWINPEIKDFYKFDNSKQLKDIKLVNYEHLGRIPMPVAV